MAQRDERTNIMGRRAVGSLSPADPSDPDSVRRAEG